MNSPKNLELNGNKKVELSTKICSNGRMLPRFGVRHTQCLLIFMCVTVAYMSNNHIAVTIVAMTHLSTHNELPTYNNSAFEINNSLDVIPDIKFQNNSAKINGDLLHNSTYNDNDFGKSTRSVFQTYPWPKSVQEIILMANVFGSCVSMFPMGLISKRWGGKLPLMISLLLNSIVLVMIPWVALLGDWKLVVVFRFLQGFFQGSLYPCSHTLLAKWVPVSEKSRFTSYVYSGTNVGTVLAYQVSGLLSASAAGWPSVFWLTGALSLIASLSIGIYGKDSPSHHKKITLKEKAFITGCNYDKEKKKSKIPWGCILRSKHVWATFIAHVASGMCFVFTTAQVPTYVHNILKINVRDSGLLSSLPHIAKIISAMLIGVLSDYFINRNIISTKAARITCNSIGFLGVSVCLTLVPYTTDPVISISFFIVSLGLLSSTYSGWMVNYIDLSPNYCSILIAIGNTLVHVCLFTLPVMVSCIVTDVTDQYQWRKIFLLIASIPFVCNLFFAFMMSAEKQPWNDNGYESTEQEQKLNSIK